MITTQSIPSLTRGRAAVLLFALIGSLAILPRAHAQTPTIVSTVPAKGATGVSPTAPVIFTFNKPMDESATYPVFFDTSGNPLPTTDTWSADMTKMTSTPMAPWPNPNKLIAWSVNGFDQNFEPLDSNTSSGYFTTGSGGSSTGSGTNKITSFVVGRINYYDQTSSAAPFLNHDMAYSVYAGTTLASNRTASAISVTLPSGGASNLIESVFAPEVFTFIDYGTNATAFEAKYPGGNYLINVQAASSNQQVTLNLSASSVQPPAPHVSNFTAAQSVDPSKPFTLTWDAFAGGTASDYIGVQISTNFTTANPGTAGALNGTATSVVIPANTLPPSRFLDNCQITFYHSVAATNTSYATASYRATSTDFFITTTAGSGPLVLTNAAWANGAFTFQVTSDPGQTLTVEYSTTLKSGGWTTLTTTNSSSGRVTISDPQTGSDRFRFYRARPGN